MRLLFDLFSHDPSKKWPPARPTPLALHLASGSLNGIALGGTFDAINILGRPDNRNPFKHQRFDYARLGLKVGGEDGCVKYYTFTMQGSPPQSSCEVLLVSAHGTEILLNRETHVDALLRVLGQPSQKTQDEDEITCIYNSNRLNIAFDFDAEHKKLLYIEAGMEGFV